MIIRMTSNLQWLASSEEMSHGSHHELLYHAITVARVRIRLPYTNLVNEMHLENWDQRRNSNQCR